MGEKCLPSEKKTLKSWSVVINANLLTKLNSRTFGVHQKHDRAFITKFFCYWSMTLLDEDQMYSFLQILRRVQPNIFCATPKVRIL